MRTQVAIVGAGPAGMVLALLLRAEKVDCVVLERRDRAYVEGRVRAGVLEQGSVDLLRRLDVAGRLEREGLVHDGTNVAVDGTVFRVDMAALTGRAVTVYGQQEVMRDLFDAAADRDLAVVWDAEVAAIDVAGSDAAIWWRDDKASSAWTAT